MTAIHQKNQILRTLDGNVYTLDPVSTIALLNSYSTQTAADPTFAMFLTSTLTQSYVSPKGKFTNYSTGSVSSKTTALIVGLAVGLSFTVFLLCILCFLFFNRYTYTKWFRFQKKNSKKHWKNDTFEWNPTSYRGQRMTPKGDIQQAELPKLDYEDGVTMNYTYMKNLQNSVHIITPKNAYHSCAESTFVDSSVGKTDFPKQEIESYQTKYIDRYLYSKPPKIQEITSEIPSKNNSVENISQNSKKTKKHWTYGSPLSRWFLNSTTYLAQSKPHSPRISLKEIQVFDERSPILDKPCNPFESPERDDNYMSVPVVDSQCGASSKSKKKNTSKISKKPSLLKNKLKSMTHHLGEIKDIKPLPLKPVLETLMVTRTGNDIKNYRQSTYQETMKLYEVITEYSPQLIDELHIVPGEYVKVLATHTDGWCLVERSNYFEKINMNIDGDDYLNENRGIVPLLCLKGI